MSDPRLRRHVDTVSALLLDLDDDDRRLAQEAARQRLRPPLLPFVIDRLIRRLRHPSPAMRRRAAESLAALGLPVVPAVALALVRGRTPAVRARLAEVLAAVGRGLDREHRAELVQTFERVMAAVKDGMVARACEEALKVLQADEQTAGLPGAPPPSN
jgi:hypothetical protein